MMKKSKALESIIREFESHGIHFDDIESSAGNYRFDLEFGGALYFSSQREMQEYLRGVVW